MAGIYVLYASYTVTPGVSERQLCSAYGLDWVLESLSVEYGNTASHRRVSGGGGLREKGLVEEITSAKSAFSER